MNCKLEILDAEKSYGNQTVLKKFNLYVKEGEFVTLLGPSGSGKTTLLKLITGFEKMDRGSIFLNGINIEEKEPYQRDIGMVFQNYALFPHMSVFNNLAYPLQRRKLNKNEVRQKVDEMLKIVQLEKHSNKRPHQLSGGQQQRVALARAIIFNPSILLLDEPLGALDKSLRKEMQGEIKEIQQRFNITTISVTHDQEEALTMSDRICVLNNGSVEQIDTPENIYKYPKTLFTAKFIGEINLLHVKNIDNSNGKYLSVELLDNTEVKVKNGKTTFNTEKMLLALRPEVFFIKDDLAHSDNFLEVKIIKIQYVGEYTVFKTKTSAGEEVEVKLINNRYQEFELNQKIKLGWHCDEGRLIQNT